MKRLAISSLASLMLVSLPTIAMADFDGDVEKAYAPYRIALFKSNQNDAVATKKAIAKFQSIWDGTILVSYPNPPARYANDADWSVTLTTIQGIAKQAAGATADGQVAKAHEILEAIRDELDALRDRNGVRVFSNFVNAYHSEMEHMFGLKAGSENWTGPVAAKIREQVGVLGYLSRDLAAHVPDQYQDNAEFNTLLTALLGSVDALRAALDGADPAAIDKAITALKPAYAKLFVKFG